MKTTLKKSTCKSRFLLALLSFVVCQSITKAQTSWNTNGNAGSFSNFIGTTNNFPFLFRTNNVERMRIQPNGFVGIGVANPLQRLDIFGNLRVRGNIYVDQNVYQQGQFDADTVDAGVLNAGDISATKVSADSIRGHVYTMDENSKFVGESKFQNSVKIQENLLIGENANNETSEKFEVRGGNAKFDGDVNIMGSVKITSIYDNLNGYPQTPGTFRLLTVDEHSELRASGIEGKYDINCSVPVIGWAKRPGEALYSMANGSTFYGPNVNFPDDIVKCPIEGNVGIGTVTPNYKLEVVGEINASGIRINSVPLFTPWLSADNGNIKYTIGNVGIGTNNPTEKLDVDGGLKVSGNTFLSRLIVNTTSNQYNANAKLAVTGLSIFEGNIITLGDITSKKIKVCANGWCDYVFEKEYKLTPLKEVEKFIAKNKHLPDVPSAKEIENQEVDIFEMQKIQMKKIEELTLYLIELKKENDEMKLILNSKK
jgi:hypothetical protein